jgi:hypothetical protein
MFRQEAWYYCMSKMESPPDISGQKTKQHGIFTMVPVSTKPGFLMASRGSGRSFDIILKRRKHVLVSYEVVEADLQHC